MNIKINILPPNLEIQLSGANQLWTLKSHLEIPLSAIQSVETIDSANIKDYLGILPWKAGTYIPDIVAEGTFYEDHQRLFLDIHEGKSAILLKLKNDHYSEILLQVDDPLEVKSQIEKTLEK